MSRARDRVHFLEGGGRMGALMRAHNWSKSPLGAPEKWPNPLKMAISTCLASHFPMVVWWGPELLMLYNDAWQPILGDTKGNVAGVIRVFGKDGEGLAEGEASGLLGVKQQGCECKTEACQKS